MTGVGKERAFGTAEALPFGCSGWIQFSPIGIEANCGKNLSRPLLTGISAKFLISTEI
jgi:hypothetical protein